MYSAVSFQSDIVYAVHCALSAAACVKTLWEQYETYVVWGGL